MDIANLDCLPAYPDVTTCVAHEQIVPTQALRRHTCYNGYATTEVRDVFSLEFSAREENSIEQNQNIVKLSEEAHCCEISYSKGLREPA